jgi:hypothetical protein
MAKNQPDDLATILGHLLVGAGVGIVTAKLAKAAVPAIVLAIIAIAIHAELDAPLSRKLSEFGL